MADVPCVFGWLGFHFVPENHCAPVFRLGMYRRVCGPGHVWTVPILERLGLNIYTGIRTETFVFDEVFSADQVSFQVEVTVRFSFRPEQCAHEVAVQIVRAGDRALTALVRDFTEGALRDMLGQFRAEDLFQRRYVGRAIRIATQLVTSRLQRRGLCLLADGGLIMKRMEPPERYRNTALTVDQLRKVMEVLVGQSDGVVAQTLAARLISAIEESDLVALSLGDGAHSPTMYSYLGGSSFRRATATSSSAGDGKTWDSDTTTPANPRSTLGR